jgi:hypothetical protein
MIENSGVLDVESLSLIGASTKREDDSKIGFFGSGNKYAMATLLRYNVPFRVFAGEKEISIECKTVEFRGKKFERIYIEGTPTSLTTDMGPDWKEWMAVREWVSNSLDEGGSTIVTKTDNVRGKEGCTRFFVGHSPNIVEMVNNWNLYFTQDREDSLYENTTGKLFFQSSKNNTLHLYRKGIKALNEDFYKSLYHYDLVHFTINESRIIDSLYSASYVVVKYLNTVKDVNILKHILQKAFLGSDKYWEGSLEWKYAVDKLSETWREAIGDRVIILDDLSGFYEDVMLSKPYYIVSHSMCTAIKKSFQDVKVYGIADEDNCNFKSVEPTPKINFLLKECMDFFKETSYPVDYPIEIVEFFETGTLGQALEGKILLSSSLFSHGKKEIVSTIIEENEHLKTNFKDNTRSFQNHFINLFLSEKEERFGIFL